MAMADALPATLSVCSAMSLTVAVVELMDSDCLPMPSAMSMTLVATLVDASAVCWAAAVSSSDEAETRSAFFVMLVMRSRIV